MLRFSYLTFVLMLLAFTHCQTKADYDLIIRNGRVYDGSLGELLQADVGIRGDRIAAIENLPEKTAAREIDAEGLAVAPGYIDMHVHLSAIRERPDMESRRPTSEELEQRQAQVEQAMQEGAFGISTGLKYVPGTFSEVEEVIALSQVASQYGGIYTSHLREEGLGVIEADAFADLVIFDPAPVIDKATFEQPHQYPEGIPYVLVNGQVVVGDGNFQKIRAGHVLKNTTTEKESPSAKE